MSFILYLEHAPDIAESLEALIQAAKEASFAIDQAILYHLCTTMLHHVQAVLIADGWYTQILDVF
jgi:hypothetical protein